MKRIIFFLTLFLIILSGCAQTKAPEPGSALPSFEAYRRAQEVKELSNDRNQEVQRALGE
jgi:outer membrane lipoprotein-sorting protein